MSNDKSIEPCDVLINGVGFSLKEYSHLLNNMGLYQFLNIFTGSNHKRGLHAFENFALTELNNWFCITRNLIVKALRYQKWTNSTNKKQYTMEISNGTIELCTDGVKICIDDFDKMTYSQYKKSVPKNGKKIISHFIRKNIGTDVKYVRSKKICAEKAGANIVDYVMSNIIDGNNILKSVFRFPENSEYYYAKVTNEKVACYHVPLKQNITKNVQKVSVKSSVPDSQLNIITTFEIEGMKEKIVVRNEIRYSHGQLNGTPEAKLYYGQNTVLPYDRII